VLGLLLAVAVLAALRAIYRTIFSIADNAVPHAKTEGCAAVTLLMIATGIAVFIAFLIVGAFAFEFLIEAAVSAVIVASLAKSADRRADALAIRHGYGRALASALDRTVAIQPEFSGWRNFVNTSPPSYERISHIRDFLSSADSR
jgi:Zn-dependent protease with chaperone function